MNHQLGMAVVGAGYWGPNLARNVALGSTADLRWVCDVDEQRAQRLAAPWGSATATAELDEVLADDRVEAVAIATPAHTHADLAIRCLRAGKHVLIEKPIASSMRDAERIIQVAQDERRVLMCDHTYCYTPAVRYIRSAVESGELGDIHFIDSVRVNLGLVQRDIDVLWDLAPHDLSILEHVLPADLRIVSVAAHGADPIGAGRACVGYLALELEGGAIAHVSVNWLSPTKVRTMMIGGSRRTLVWNDLDPAQRISIYDRGVEIEELSANDARRNAQIAYRLGDMTAPALDEHEALRGVIDELVASVREEREPLTGATSGLMVLRVLEAASASLLLGGVAVPIDQNVGHDMTRTVRNSDTNALINDQRTEAR